ncbi:MAG: N-hydroxyarylamine O-acetyltransferase [Deltaproteobacteria bacterium]|nr:N-hydroxyarylamine O-acetyltransferase [Deltaproteobacteria bacterium]
MNVPAPTALLDAYFRRIGDTGSREPTLATLHRLCAAHVQSIPFENLDVLLGRGINLDPAVVDRKLLHAGRGGYCFEHNTLLLRVLETLGFDVRPISARVRLQRPRDFTPARTHVFVRVELEGESWLADVGVGGLSPTSALRLHTEDEQATPHEPRRIVRQDGRYFHQVRLADAWSDVCEFTLEEMPAIDREVGNWYTSAHPQSHFKSRLVVARAFPGGRVSILNRELTVRRGGVAETTVLASPEALLEALSEHFGLQFPPGTEFPCPALDWPAR